MTVDWRWPNFSIDELKCNCCGAHILVPEFMDRLQALRTEYGRPMKITSGYRCSRHNADISFTGLTGPHTTGRAVDILCSNKEAYDLLRLAMKHGFTGVGIKQSGAKNTRFLHFDDIPDRIVRPTVWNY